MTDEEIKDLYKSNQEKVDAAVAKLREHFDIVVIGVSSYDDEDDSRTTLYHSGGSGNHFARTEICRLMRDEFRKCIQDYPEDDGEEDWKTHK